MTIFIVFPRRPTIVTYELTHSLAHLLFSPRISSCGWVDNNNIIRRHTAETPKGVAAAGPKSQNIFTCSIQNLWGFMDHTARAEMNYIHGLLYSAHRTTSTLEANFKYLLQSRRRRRKTNSRTYYGYSSTRDLQEQQQQSRILVVSVDV